MTIPRVIGDLTWQWFRYRRYTIVKLHECLSEKTFWETSWESKLSWNKLYNLKYFKTAWISQEQLKRQCSRQIARHCRIFNNSFKWLARLEILMRITFVTWHDWNNVTTIKNSSFDSNYLIEMKMASRATGIRFKLGQNNCWLWFIKFLT